MTLFEGILLMMTGAVLMSIGTFLGVVISYVAHTHDEKNSLPGDMYWDDDTLYDVESALNDMNVGLNDRLAYVNEILRTHATRRKADV